MAFFERFFGKKKEEVKVLKELNLISRLCPATCQGILMNHAEVINKAIREKMDLDAYDFSKAAMSVSVKIFNSANNKVFYTLELARGLNSIMTNDSYSRTIDYRVDSKYNVTLSISVYVKNRYLDGKDRAKLFFDMVEKQFMRECKIR